MKIAVVGTGNVGSAVLTHLIDVPLLDEILVMNRTDERSKAAIMDAASANPEGSLKLVEAPYTRLNEADILLMTSGVQLKKGQTGEDVGVRNKDVMSTILKKASVKDSAIVIGLATPVDAITPHIQKRCGLPHNQVFGFGCDLDRNRLIYVLKTRNAPAKNVGVVGAHGKNVIPVYRGEKDYEKVANCVRYFLADITAHGGSPRNLATGFLLARLVESIVTNANRVHYVCGYHPLFRCYISWPFRIGCKGVLEPEQIELPSHAESDLKELLKKR